MSATQQIILPFLICVSISCFGGDRPLSNTPEHKAAHGYVEGQPTELWIRNTLLRFPPDVRFTPATSGKIEEGRAQEVTLGLAYPDLDPSKILNGVSIRLTGGYENPVAWDKAIEKEVWKEVIDKPELGLREYHRQRYNGAWGYITYVATDDSDRTPKGSLIKYRCQGYPEGEITRCMGHFVLQDDLMVTYMVKKTLLPHWRKIHQDVLNRVDSLIVK